MTSKLKVKANHQTGFWEIHDRCGFLCKLESESTARELAHAVNVLPGLLTAAREVLLNTGVDQYPPPKRSLDKLRAALTRAESLNPKG